MATDRLTLARAFSASGMEQDRAEQVATAIFDAIHDNVATKADLQLAVIELRTAAKADIAELRNEMRAGFAEARIATNADIGALRNETKANLSDLRHELTMRAITGMIAAGGLLVAALHYWPPGHG